MLLSNGSDLEQTELEGSGRGLPAWGPVLPASQQTNFQPGYLSNVEVQEHCDNFFEELFTELQEKSRAIEEMNVCDNLGNHLMGNVFVKFWFEEDAEPAGVELSNRWLSGQAVRAELSPVSDFRELCCQQCEIGECTRGGFCNFMHLQLISRKLYGPQVTPMVPYPPPSPRKKPTTFPRPLA